MKQNRKISWALVGLGTQGRRLAMAMKTVKNTSLAAVIAKDMERAKKFAEEFGVPRYYNSLAQALRYTAKVSSANQISIDAVCIATPDDEHAVEAIRALRAGKDVFCEKPMALDPREGAEIIRAEKLGRAHCFVDFQLRQSPAVLRARELIKSGALGKVVYIEMGWSIGSFEEAALPPLPRHMQWRDDVKRAAGGALSTRGSHLFDLLRFLTGEEVVQVQAYSDATSRTVDRTAVGILTLGSGAPAVIATSKKIPAAQNQIAIYGQNGKIVLKIFDGMNTLVYTNAKKTIEKNFHPISLYAAAFGAFNNPLAKNQNATASDAMKVVIITDAFKRSVEQKQSVRLSNKKF